MVYLLHFTEKYHHSRHYIGFVDGGEKELQSRLKRHESGTGARLMEVIKNAGIEFKLARTWPEGDRNFERRLKNMKKSSRYCPICRANHKEDYHGKQKVHLD